MNAILVRFANDFMKTQESVAKLVGEVAIKAGKAPMIVGKQDEH